MNKTILPSEPVLSGTLDEYATRWTGPPVAILWDQSLVWGLICVETLKRLGIPHHLLSAGDVAGGTLDCYRVLLVPGGWASHKVRVLGEMGKERVRAFIRSGGSYLGFCGGAGLALSSPPSLGLVPLERMPLEERLPNASGEVWIEGPPDHPIWEHLPRSLPVSIWWPSQFSRSSTAPHLRTVGTYTAPGSDFMVADLAVSDYEGPLDWSELEKLYGINLNPKRIMGHPALLEAQAGRGTLILSYPHLETPGETLANRLLFTTLAYLDRKATPFLPLKTHLKAPLSPSSPPPGTGALDHLLHMHALTEELIRFGEQHLFWNWRRPWVLNWRRGIRGLEYGTLAVSIRSMVTLCRGVALEQPPPDPWLHPLRRMQEQLREFCRLAKCLLLEEKLAARTGQLSKLGKVNPTVDSLRCRLFGERMHHGGLCRTIFDTLDVLLLELLRHASVHNGMGDRTLFPPRYTEAPQSRITA